MSLLSIFEPVEFRLVYRGPLKARGKKSKRQGELLKHMQDLRRAFHPQLKRLTEQPHFKNESLFSEQSQDSVIQKVGLFSFAPFVPANKGVIAELDILFLRPGPPGSLVNHGGDIDNRIKTLLDSLAVPNPQQIPENDKPKENEKPFFCLLQDDALVTSLSVTADRLLDLDPEAEKHMVQLVIRVHVKIVIPLFESFLYF